jgi:hypothetical protein
MDNLTLTELITLKSMFENELDKSERFTAAERGYNHEEYNKRYIIYKNNIYHEKLERINNQIKLIMESF